MARGKNKKLPAFGNIEFIRCELDSAEKKKVAAWVTKPPMPVEDLLIEVLQSGHKVSYSFSEHNDSFICSVTGKPDDCINASKCYTSHAKDPVTALWVALYKFHVVWAKGVWESAAEESDFG